MSNCKVCGVTVPSKYKECYNCKFKPEKPKKDVNLHAQYKICLWQLAVIFLGGAILGAYLFS